MLRRKSLEFVRGGLWVRLKALRTSGKKAWEWWDAFSREERIFTLFGVLSSFWTVYSLWQALDYYQNRLAAAIMAVFWEIDPGGRTAMLVVGVLVGIGLVIYLGYALIRLARRGLALADQARLFATPRRQATWAWGVVLLAGAGVSFYPSLTPLVSLEALILWIYFSARSAQEISGSRLAWMFWLMSGAGCLFWLSEAARLFHFNALISAGAAALAGLLFVSGAATTLIGISPRRLSRIEKILLLAGSSAGCVWAILASLGTVSLPVSGAFPLVALALLLPVLVDFWRTGSALAFASIELGALAWLGAALSILPGTCAYLFLAAGFGLQWAACRRSRREHAGLPEPGPEQSDSQLLKLAFYWMAGCLNAQLL